MYKIILAAGYAEAAGFAREQGFRTGEYRIASRPSSIHGLKVAEVYELPSFGRRRDVHALKSKLRYAKIPAWHVIDDGWEWPRPKWCVCPQQPLDAEPGKPCGDCGGRIPEIVEFATPTTTTTDAQGATVSVVEAEVAPIAASSEVLPQKPAPAKVKGRRRPAAPRPEPVVPAADVIDELGF